ACARSDQYDQALKLYKQLLKKKKKKEKSLWEYKIAYTYFDRGHYAKASQAFQDFLDAYPNHERKDKVLWMKAWAHYYQRDFSKARVYWKKLQQELSKNPYQDSLIYWIGRSFEKEGQSQKAKELYRQVAYSPQYDYYAFLSLKRLSKDFDIQTLPTSPWIEEIKKTQSHKLPKLIKISQDEHSRLNTLYHLGLIEDFIRALQKEKPKEAWALAYQKSMQEVWESPRVYKKMSEGYPTVYAPWVLLFSYLHDFPPQVTWSIMRTESFYNPKIVSPADARGLMQIIPPTAHDLAQKLGKESFNVEDLWNPAISIELGVYYLSQNLKHFKGNLVYTIASYNAGEESVDRWLKIRSDLDWDEFVESIPYTETRNYVKKVLKFYYFYTMLYPV
ncbi:MAG: transglycosylase SLT domain-containing protein, partial [Deltaproteobacteria bacterium]|nr:transglycosylase SLT domain-containing protein [Deltaproteobacteria bacterium]